MPILKTKEERTPQADVGYIRVSSTSQNVDRQLEGVKLDKWFTDKASGKNMDRPELQKCLLFLREDDTLHVHSMDRLGRSMSDLLKMVKELKDRGVNVKFHKENLFFPAKEETSPRDALLFNLVAALSQFERDLIRERQAEGIAAAKARGVYTAGRPRHFTDAEQDALLEQRENGVSGAFLGRKHGVSRSVICDNVKAARLRREAREAAQVQSITSDPATAPQELPADA